MIKIKFHDCLLCSRSANLALLTETTTCTSAPCVLCCTKVDKLRKFMHGSAKVDDVKTMDVKLLSKPCRPRRCSHALGRWYKYVRYLVVISILSCFYLSESSGRCDIMQVRNTVTVRLRIDIPGGAKKC